jgi:hypothetical protein
MEETRRRLRYAVGLAVAATALTGCGSTPSAANHPALRSVQTQPSPAPAQKVSPDVRACAGVQGVLGHLTADTQTWAPNRRPFDKAVAAHIRLRASELSKQAPQARTAQVRSAVQGTAGAFVAVADAMGSGHRSRVTRAIATSRTAYKQLKLVCPQ